MAASRGVGDRSRRVVAVVVVGAVVGALVGALAYEWLAPLLDRRTDWLRETQGLLWNLVPVLGAVGAGVAYAVARRRGR